MTVFQSAMAGLIALTIFLVLGSIVQGLMIRAAVHIIEKLARWNPKEPMPTVSVPVALGIGFTGTATRVVIGAATWCALTINAALGSGNPDLIETHTTFVLSRLTWLVDPIVVALMADTTLVRGIIIAFTSMALTLVLGGAVFLGLWFVYTPARYAFW